MNTVKIGIIAAGLFLGNQVIAQNANAHKNNGQGKSDPAKMFARIDKNGDGSIDKVEFAAAKEKREEKTGKEINEEKQFSKIDTDKNGLISKQEFIIRKEKMSENGKGKEKNVEGDKEAGEHEEKESTGTKPVKKTSK